MELKPHETKGRRAYWTAVWIWVLAVNLGTTAYFMKPGLSLAGKILIGIGLILSALFLFRASDPARYFAGAVALLGLMTSLPAACSVFNPETQIEGLISLVFVILCGLVWHAFLISDNVSAYLQVYRRNRGLPPGD